MKITESKLRRIIRNYIVENYDGLGRPNWDNEEKLRKAGKFDGMGNISKSDEEEAAAHIQYRDDLGRANDRKRVEIEKAKLDQEERKKKRLADVEEFMTSMSESKLRRTLRRVLREFGESDAEVIRQSQNREKMIGIGMDGGTIGFDPNWDYASNRPLRPKKMHRLKPELQMVADMIRGGGIGDELELMPGRNGGPPDMFYFTMVGSGIRARCDYKSYNVQKNHPDFTGEGPFITVQNPDNVKGAFEEGAETNDPADVERLLEKFIAWASANTQEDSVWMTFAPAS